MNTRVVNSILLTALLSAVPTFAPPCCALLPGSIEKKEEIEEVVTQFGDARKSEIVEEIGAFNEEDLIKDEDILITISYAGYIKRQKIDEFKNQKRGGKGIVAGTTREEDFIQDQIRNEKLILSRNTLRLTTSGWLLSDYVASQLFLQE